MKDVEKRRIRTKNVSPTIQLGTELSLPMLVPCEISKIPPRHESRSTFPRFMSAGLIDHELPPKENATVTLVSQANSTVMSKSMK